MSKRTPTEHADDARDALDAHSMETGGAMDTLDDNIIALLCDLRHLCATDDITDFDELVAYSRDDYEREAT